MLTKIINLRNFRARLSHYVSQVMKGDNIVINSKGREVVLISLEEYKKLTGDETDYLFSTEANKTHLLKGKEEVEKDRTSKISLDELFD